MKIGHKRWAQCWSCTLGNPLLSRILVAGLAVKATGNDKGAPEGAPFVQLEECQISDVSLRTFAEDHHADGFKQDQQVEEQRVVLDVVQVVLVLVQRVFN